MAYRQDLMALGLIIVSLLISSPVYSSDWPGQTQDVTASLVGAWTFNEGSGSTVADSSGNGNNGTIQGGLIWSDSSLNEYFDNDFIQGNAMSFAGSTDLVKVNDSASLGLTNQISIEAWVWPDIPKPQSGFIGRSCYDILYQGGSVGDGLYTIDPDGAGGLAPRQVYCDMTMDGGGWTRLNNQIATATTPFDSNDLLVTNNVGGGCSSPGSAFTISNILVEHTYAKIHLTRTTSIVQCAGLVGINYDTDYWNGSGWTSNGMCTWGDGIFANACCSATNMTGLKLLWKLEGGKASTGQIKLKSECSGGDTGQIQVTAWVRGGPGGIVKDRAYGIMLNGYLVRGLINGNKINSTLNPGWNHVVLTYDKALPSGNMKLYINSQLKGQLNVTEAMSVNTNPLLIGNGFRGTLDEVRIYQGTLSDSEIKQRYQLFSRGLIGRWQFDRGYGTTASDSSGQGADGTLTNGPLWVNSDIRDRFENWEDSGNALGFDGSNDFVDFSGKTVAQSGNSARTILAWIKTSATKYQAIVSSGTPSNTQAFNLVLYSGTGNGLVGVMGYNNDFYPTSGTLVNDNEWHQVGAVYDGNGTIKTYVDGRLDNSGSKTYATAGQSNFIGKSNHVGAEQYFQGSIDQVEMFDRALEDWEIRKRFEKYSWGQVGRWKFDESSGSTALDSSGQGNNGSISGGTRAASTLGSSLNGAPTGNMLSFSNSGVMTVPHSSSLNFGLRNFTVSGWGKFQNYTYPRTTFCMNKGNAYQTQAGFEIGHGFSASGSEVALSDGVNLARKTVLFNSGSTPNDFLNTWTHFAFVFDRIYTNKAYVYVNGNLQSDNLDLSSVTGSINTGAAVLIGSIYAWTTDGSLEDMAIYNRDLDPQEIFYQANLIRRSAIPSAKIGNPANDASVKVNTPITFTTTGSSDPYGANPGLVSYFWDFDDGTAILKRDTSVTVTYTTTGVKAVKLWVIDSDGYPSSLALGQGLIYLNITTNASLFNRLDNLRQK